MIRLWLTVKTFGTSNWPTDSDLWTKDLDTAYLPPVGADLILWPTEEEGPGGGPTWNVKRVYWDADGQVNADLAAMLLDPPELARPTFSDPPRECSWHTGVDGDPVPFLERGGWTRYTGQT